MFIIYALLAAFFASFVTIFAKIGLKNVDSNLATTLRAIIMAFFLSIVVFVVNRTNLNDIRDIQPRDLLFIALSGIAGAISWLFYFLALKEGEDNASKVAALDKLSLVFVFIFALIFLNEKFELPTLIGVILMTAGAIIISIK